MQNKKKKHHHSFSPFQNGKNSFDFDRFVIGDKMSVRASVCVCVWVWGKGLLGCCLKIG